MKIIRIIIFFLVITAICGCGNSAFADTAGAIRVGIYDNKPKIFVTDDGKASGFWPDIIEYIGSKENWNIEYVYGTWEECMSRLETGEIDVMPDVAYSEERAGLYRFSEETVYVSWSSVYVREGEKIQSVLDLEGKTIAVLKNSINVVGPEGIVKLLDSFKVECTFLAADSYLEVFRLVESGLADAGVASKDFAAFHQDAFHLDRTSVLFSPVSLAFAFPLDSEQTDYLIERINYHVANMKADRDSVLYRAMEDWLGVKPIEKRVIPLWLIVLISVIGGITLILITVGMIMRSRMRARTSQLKLETGKRSAAELSLEESEARYHDLVNNSPIGVYINQDGKFKYVNPEFQRLTGYTETQLLNMTADAIVHPEDKVTVRNNAIEMLKGNRTSGYEFRVVTPEGDIRWAMETVTSITYHNEKASLGSCMDITELKKVEEEFRQSEEKLNATVDSIPQGLIVTDTEGIITQVNRSAMEMFGCTSESEIVGKNGLDFVDEEDRETTREKILQTRTEGTKTTLACTAITLSGERFPAEMSVAPIREYSGEVVGMVGIIEDSTEQIRMQENLIVTDRLASVGELAAGIAHELNNPLTAVIGFSDLLMLRDDIPDDVKEDLSVINMEAMRTSQVARHLLTFARKHPDEKRLVNVNSILELALNLRAYEQRVNNINVISHLSQDISEVSANDFQLQQVFINIIINAEHFMIEENGGGTLEIITEQTGNVLRVTIADDGPGINQEHLNRIFDPFFTTKEVGKGTGLGLSICHGIITEHGGRIWAESISGQGATFIVELPVTSGDDTDDQDV